MFSVEICDNKPFIFSVSTLTVFQSMFLSDGDVVFFSIIIFCNSSKFLSFFVCINYLSMLFGCVGVQLLLVFDSFRKDFSCLLIFGESVIALVSCLYSLFVFWRIYSISRSENQPFFIIVLNWPSSLWLVLWNLAHLWQTSIILFLYIFFALLLEWQWSASFLSSLVHVLRCSRPENYYYYHYYYYYYLVIRDVHISVSWWFSTGLWGTASLLKSPGLFSVFWPFSIML